ncbi:MAG: DNA-protecting protein DprA, partial [Solirubrobacterales bacterium]|nr:DNA-protecting protein DprA [Solirubrobacterales bacterium]
YRRIVATGAILSELPSGAAVRRWAPPARNRLIAALASVTVVVEAGGRSGALVTASYARELGRPVGAVPGRVTSDLAAGCNALIRSGATLIRRAQDVLDELFGERVVTHREAVRAPLREELERLLCAVGAGHDTIAALGQSGFRPEHALAGLSELELCGYVRREPGGRFLVVP